MKHALLFSVIIFISYTAFAQYNPVTSMQNDFKNILKGGAKTTGYEALQTYKNDDAKGSQFYFPVFTDGSVTTKNNEVITGIYQFLFDKVRQLLFIISKSDKREKPEILLAEKDQIRSFVLRTDRDHVFVRADKYDPDNHTDFYELLKGNDSAYSLLKFIRTTFVKLDTRDVEKMKRGEMYDEFVDKIEYYISFRLGKLQPVSLKKRSIIGSFPADKKAFLEDYMQSHSQDDMSEDFLAGLVEAVNK